MTIKEAIKNIGELLVKLVDSEDFSTIEQRTALIVALEELYFLDQNLNK